MTTEEIKDGYLVITSTACGSKLSLPMVAWGHPGVLFNGNHIPSAKLWGIIASHAIEGKTTPRPDLIREAKRAEIYRQLKHGMYVWTINPKPEDRLVEDSMYVREDKQRIRPLIDRFDITICKIEDEITPSVIQTITSFFAQQSLFPVGMVDERIYLSKDPEAVFEAFGSRDWLRIGVFFKRPGSSSVPLTIGD